MLDDKTTSRVLAGAALASAALFSCGALAYPGGTHFDHSSPGHDFWLNTLCDVARGVALNGADNLLGSALARVAMTIFVVGVGLTLAILPELARTGMRTRALVRMLASVATSGAVAVVHLPTDRYSGLHAIAIVTAGVPAILATLVGWLALVRERARYGVPALLGGAFLVVSAADFAVYVNEVATSAPPTVLLPVLERIATLLALAFMVAVAREARRACG